MAADDVAKAVLRVAVGTPVNGTFEVAGPQQFRFDELIRQGLAAYKDSREVVADPHARYFGAQLDERSLVPWGRRDSETSGSTSGSARRRSSSDSSVAAGVVPERGATAIPFTYRHAHAIIERSDMDVP